MHDSADCKTIQALLLVKKIINVIFELFSYRIRFCDRIQFNTQFLEPYTISN